MSRYKSFPFPTGPDASSQSSSLPLFFHPYTKGSQIVMDESHCIAHRAATFHDGIVFSSRPIGLYEKVTLKILKEETKWHGGLRVGFTWQDPSLLEPSELPPFACPNLVQQGKTRACVLPEEYGAEGTVVSFWVDSQGCVFCSVDEEAGPSVLLAGVSVSSPLWALVDVYGRAKAVQLLDPSSLSTNADVCSLLLSTPDEQTESTCQSFHRLPDRHPGDECAVCFGYKANTMMLPCSHANFCSCCSLKIFKTSGRCPLCRQKVKKILPISVSAKGESPEG
ncbi:E3 ubiquitin-protein ligase NEURL3 isoform X1 [Pogona vitticeps]